MVYLSICLAALSHCIWQAAATSHALAARMCDQWVRTSPSMRVLRAAFCEGLLEKYGMRLMGPIAILRNWTFCLFYVMAELWGSVVVSLLFWGFANQVRCMLLCVCASRSMHVCWKEGPTNDLHCGAWG